MQKNPHYIKQQKYYNGQLYLPNNVIYINNITDVHNLMVVAHPDDEIIFGGNVVLNNNFLVIYCTNDFKRIEIIRELSKDYNFNAIILSHIDCPHKDMIFDNELIAFLLDHIQHNKYNMIVTHNKHGEYGHIQHVLIHKIIIDIIYKMNLNNLFIFNKQQITSEQFKLKKQIMMDYYSFADEQFEHHYNYDIIKCEYD